ncbi:MAG: nitroreductase family protein [SAR324 cluster bacterium]|nr:nitroreductase family protein [SAR324 cluster bacterium]
MDILNFLTARNSIAANKLIEPAPTSEQLGQIFQAAVSAPDHGRIHPWRFIVIEGDARKKLGDVFVRATKLREPDAYEGMLETLRSKPLRSPMIIAVCAIVEENHPKAPEVEQIISAGCAAHSLMMALNALNFGAILLTGPNAHDNLVKKELGLEEKDVIVGFVYTGTPEGEQPSKTRPDYQQFVEYFNPESN